MWSTASQADLFDRLTSKADEIANAAENLDRDIETVSNADEIAAAGVDAAGRQAEQQAIGAVAATEPVQDVRAVGREVTAAEVEAGRITTTDERAEALVDGQMRRAESALDVEARAESSIRRSDPVLATREADREVRQTEGKLSAAQGADEIAAAEARRLVDPQPELDRAENSLDRARRSLRDLD